MTSVEINLHQVMEYTKGTLRVVEGGKYRLDIGESLTFEYSDKASLIRAVVADAFSALRERESNEG